MVELWVGVYDRCRGSLTAVRSAEATREISHREIGVLKVVRTMTLKVSKSRHNRYRPFGRTRGSNRAPPGEAQQEASSENRESEFHESREQLHHISQNCDTRFFDKTDSVWATLEDRWQVKGREPSEDQCIGNRNQYSCGWRIGKSLEETPTRNLNRPFGGTRVRSTEEVGDRKIANSRGKETNADFAICDIAT
jgi:hypothetical protein